MSYSPEGFLDAALLRRLAGEQPFASGEACFVEGRVRQLHASADRVTGRVEGSRAYRVKLWRSRGEFQFSCTCTAGQDHAFCKHCVAVGLAWLAAPGASGESTPAAEPLRGARSPEEVEQNVAAVEKGPLPADVLARLDEIAAMVPYRPFEEPFGLPFGRNYRGPGMA